MSGAQDNAVITKDKDMAGDMAALQRELEAARAEASKAKTGQQAAEQELDAARQVISHAA